MFGTVDSWLLYHLTGGAVHATDVTNASRTLMMDLATLQVQPYLALHIAIYTAVHIAPIYTSCAK